VARALGVREVLLAIAPLAATITDLARWPAEEKARLAAVLRARVGRGERNYVRALLRAAWFRKHVARF
jgi:hypothetical protein